jgi:hypothetical protein
MMFGGMDKMLGQMMDKFKRDLEQGKQALSECRVEASAGGGVVTAIANGNGELLEIKIAPEAVDPAEVEMLQDMVLAAVREVLDDAKALKAEKLGGLLGGAEALGLDVSGLF